MLPGEQVRSDSHIGASEEASDMLCVCACGVGG